MAIATNCKAMQSMQGFLGEMMKSSIFIENNIDFLQKGDIFLYFSYGMTIHARSLF